ncbi:hypothetical protein Tco_1532116 [Tanacetum coccineum]
MTICLQFASAWNEAYMYNAKCGYIHQRYQGGCKREHSDANYQCKSRCGSIYKYSTALRCTVHEEVFKRSYRFDDSRLHFASNWKSSMTYRLSCLRKSFTKMETNWNLQLSTCFKNLRLFIAMRINNQFENAMSNTPKFNNEHIKQWKPFLDSNKNIDFTDLWRNH